MHEHFTELPPNKFISFYVIHVFRGFRMKLIFELISYIIKLKIDSFDKLDSVKLIKKKSISFY